VKRIPFDHLFGTEPDRGDKGFVIGLHRIEDLFPAEEGVYLFVISFIQEKGEVLVNLIIHPEQGAFVRWPVDRAKVLYDVRMFKGVCQLICKTGQKGRIGKGVFAKADVKNNLVEELRIVEYKVEVVDPFALR
jgi:hypothetical protein